MNYDELARHIMDCLFQYEPDGLDKYELAVILDVDANEIKRALPVARELARDIGREIPTAIAEDGFKYRLCDDADRIWASQLHHERQITGLERVRDWHARAVRSRRDQLEAEDQIIMDNLWEITEMQRRQQSEMRAKMVEVATNLRRARRERPDGDAA